MPRLPSSWRLSVLLVVLAGVVALAARMPAPAVGDVAEAVAPASGEAPPNAPERLDVARLADRALPPLSPTLFGNLVAVPPAPVVNLPPAPPPKPVAPPLPYTYLGQYRDADGAVVFYLRKDEQVILAKPGTQLDERYRLEADFRQGLTFTYLPLQEAQVIPIGNFAP